MVVSNQDPDVLDKIKFTVVDILPGQNIRDVIEVTPLEELRRIDSPQKKVWMLNNPYPEQYAI